MLRQILPWKINLDQNCSFSSRKTILWRILHRKRSKRRDNDLQHKLALLRQIPERKIDCDELYTFSARIPFGEFCFDIVENFQVENVFKLILTSYFEFCHENAAITNSASKIKIRHPIKNLANYAKFWHEKLIFIKIVNFSTEKSLLRRIGHRKWSERNRYLT